MFDARKNRQRRAILEAKQIELDTRQLESLTKMLDEAVAGPRFKRELEDPDRKNWELLGGDDQRKLDPADRDTLRDQATKYYHRNAHGRNIIRLIEKYVVGRGFSITPVSTLPQAKEVWDNFWRTNRMKLRKKEIVRRAMRDGEIFIRYFADGDVLLVRFMMPGLVEEPDEKLQGITGNASEGIETDKEDVETVLAYWYKDDRIPAEEVQFHKILVDSDVKRGRSFIEVSAVYLEMYDRWLKDRMKLNMIRAIVALIRKVKGTPAQAQNMAAGYATTQRRAPDGTPYMKAPEGASIITTTEGVDYEFKSPNLEAGDVANDGRAVLLAIAAGVGLPEYMVTADSNNVNYASALVAEAPGMQEFYDHQEFFAVVFEEMYTKVMETAIKKRLVPAYEIRTEQEQIINAETGESEIRETQIREKTSTECRIVFPELVHRDILKETQAYVLQGNQGWLSDRTASARLDLDYDEEQEQMALEGEEEEPEGPEEDDAEYEKIRKKETATEPVEDETEPET